MTTDPDDLPARPVAGDTLEDIFMRRRTFLKGATGAALAVGLGWPRWVLADSGFKGLAHKITKDHAVAEGFRAEVLIRWGDPLMKVLGPMQPSELDPGGQAVRFGYNCDFIGFVPVSDDHGYLCVNHEYTMRNMMFPKALRPASPGRIASEMAAHGHSVVEVRRDKGRWGFKPGGNNRRITATTPIRLSGPAAGDDRLKTADDPDGLLVHGTLNNCAGGVTPWGTVLIAEENFNGYFAGKTDGDEAVNHRRYGVGPLAGYDWHVLDKRFNVDKEPREPNRFGWIVEIDPKDPKSVPVKRTALGRFKHEGATVVRSADGRIVVFSGDDQRFEYVYRFVSAKKWAPGEPVGDLLDDGVLSVARFADAGQVDWLPLVHGKGPLTKANGFRNQADVVIEARRAADLLGATPMDRPEDIKVSPKTGKVYVALTNNTARTKVDGPNPRKNNRFGHILEMIPPGRGESWDFAADRYTWEMFIRCGNPDDPSSGAAYHEDITKDGWFCAPDNFAFSRDGRLWIATDQGSAQRKRGVPDGLYVCDTEGDARALSRLFYRVPADAECCGPCFTPDGTTLFVSVQHPGEGSSFENPSTRWPDFKDDMPPRPSVVVITREGGGKI